MGQQAEKREDKKGNRTRQKNKTGDSKVESNDSPEVPDRRETSHILGLPSGHIHTTAEAAWENMWTAVPLDYMKTKLPTNVTKITSLPSPTPFLNINLKHLDFQDPLPLSPTP